MVQFSWQQHKSLNLVPSHDNLNLNPQFYLVNWVPTTLIATLFTPTFQLPLTRLFRSKIFEVVSILTLVTMMLSWGVVQNLTSLPQLPSRMLMHKFTANLWMEILTPSTCSQCLTSLSWFTSGMVMHKLIANLLMEILAPSTCSQCYIFSLYIIFSKNMCTLLNFKIISISLENNKRHSWWDPYIYIHKELGHMFPSHCSKFIIPFLLIPSSHWLISTSKLSSNRLTKYILT